MPEYLINPFCKLETLFNFDPKIKHNILSCVFFKMKKHYKRFNIYIDGLKRLLVFRKEKMSDFKLRLFVDQSIVDDRYIMSILKNDSNVQIVKYTCPNFLEDDKYFHRGTFGTLVRFFPMFDFENNDAKRVIVTDIELNKFDTEMVEKINRELGEREEKLAFIYYSNIFFSFELGYQSQYIFAGRLFNTKRMPKESIINFINNIQNVKIVNPFYQSKAGSDTEPIKYGIDETFLNQYLLKDLDKAGIAYGYYAKYNISSYFYYNKQKILSNPNSEKYLEKILGNHYDKTKNVDENLRVLDEKTHGILENYEPCPLTTPIDKSVDCGYKKLIELPLETKEIVKNYTELIFYFDANKIYDWIPKKIVETIAKYFPYVLYEEGFYTNNGDKYKIIESIKIDCIANPECNVIKSGSKMLGGEKFNVYKYKYLKYKTKFLAMKKYSEKYSL